MCIGIPSIVTTLEGDIATVEALGETRQVSLILLDEQVSIGDYLLIQVGNFAAEIIEPERARASLLYLTQSQTETLNE